MPTLATKYKPHPSYKPSGIEWLGEIPAHWETRRLKYCAPFGNDKLDYKPEVYIYVGLENIESWTGKLLIDYQPDSVDSTVVTFDTGDVLFGKLRPYLAKVARPDFEGAATTEILVLRPTDECTQDYLAYCLLSTPYIRWIDTLTYGARMPRVSPDDVATSLIALPPLPEQRAIAAFLDRETARIDDLVARKEHLIALLREKRTALITHAVTRGLDPDAPMKDSGVGWLGEVPAHWEVKRLKSFATVQLSNVDKKSVKDQDAVRLCNYVDVYYNEHIGADIEFMSATASEEQICRFSLREGDVLITKDSELWTDIAVPAVVTRNLPNVLCGYHLAHIKPGRDCDGAFLSRAFSAVGPRDQYQIAANGITRFGLTGDAIRASVLALPPLLEQRAIATFLDRETAKIDDLIARIREAIERLKELRTALISAAVTGRIDVRGEA